MTRRRRGKGRGRGAAVAEGSLAVRVSGIRQEVDEPDDVAFERAARSIGVELAEVVTARFSKRSVDARGRGADLHFVCQIDLALRQPPRSAAYARMARSGRATATPVHDALAQPWRAGAPPHVVVIGAGPGGLFAALSAAESGARVTLLERGAAIEGRGSKVVAFHRGAPPDPDTNLLFGDGGAGTYSDGKLYTRTSDSLEPAILDALVEAGAPPGIAFDARAHIGTDRLHRILPRLRERLVRAGVELAYGTRVTGLVTAPGAGAARRVVAVRTTAGEVALDALIVAIGHSARDTWVDLARDGVVLEAKPFQLGVRIEHPQELVTRGRYGSGERAALLGPASYNLQSRGEPGAHSFCMCPGGRIVASVNEPGRLCTNGMSNSKHSSSWANAAVVTTLEPTDFAAFGHVGPLAGVELQRELEERFFAAGGGTYAAPAQRAADFLAGRESRGELRTSYGFGAVPGRIDELLPARVREAIAEALPRFDRTLPGFASEAGLLVGIETRSSGPVRMTREREARVALGFENLYPAGEGAGYAGGIMSAAIDGARSAHAALAAAARRG